MSNVDELSEAPPPDNVDKAADTNEIWKRHAERDDVLLAIIKYAKKSSLDVEKRLEYLRLVSSRLPMTLIKLPQRLRNSATTRWLEVFQRTKANAGEWGKNIPIRRELLNVWLSVVNRVFTTGWDSPTSSAAARGLFKVLLNELLDFGSRMVQASGEPELIDKYVSQRTRYLAQLRKLEDAASGNKPKQYTLQQFWFALDAPHNIEECRGSRKSMVRCRETEVSRLRMMRDRLEQLCMYTAPSRLHRAAHTVVVRLHEEPDHLFTIETYRSMRDELADFLESSDDQRHLRRPLLIRQFHYYAMLEVYTRLMEMVTELDFMRQRLQSREFDAYSEVLIALENVEWKCRYLWQDAVRSYPDEDDPDWDMWTREDSSGSTSGGLSIVRRGEDGDDDDGDDNGEDDDGDDGDSRPQPQPMTGGAEPEYDVDDDEYDEQRKLDIQRDKNRVKEDANASRMDDENMMDEAERKRLDAEEENSFDMNAQMALQDTDRSLSKIRVMVRNAAQAVKGGVTNVRTVSLPAMGKVGMFVNDCLVPRLNVVLRRIDDKLNGTYLRESPGYTGDDLAENDRDLNDRVLVRRRQRAGQMSAGKILEFKFSDISVTLMYALKGLRLIVQVGAMFVAQKVFVETYVRTVHVENGEPPKMQRMLLMFLSIDATVQLVVLLLLVLLDYAYKAYDNTFAIDDDFIMTFLVEHFMGTIILAVLGVVFAKLMRQKRYFDFANQGTVVSRAYRDIMIALSVVTFAVPFFLIL